MGNPKTTYEFDADIQQILAKLNDLDNQVKKVGKGGGGAGSGIAAGFEDALGSISRVVAGITAAYAAVTTGNKALQTAAEFEALQVRLENMYGSAERGREVFERLKEVAATTPYSLQGVVEAGASLKAFGVDAEKMIKPVADLAAFMGIEIPEAAQAFGRAMAGGAGAADILRERGILNLIKSFKGIDDLSKLTLPQFQKALIETIQDPTAGIVGATDKLSKTFKGAYSNMLDSVDQLADHIGKKMLPAATKFMQTISGMASNVLPRESEQLQKNYLEFRALAGILTDVNTAQDTRNRAIKELQDKYGSYLTNIDLEKAGYGDIQKALEAANKEFEKRIRLKAAEEILSDKMKEAVEAQKLLFEREKQYRQMMQTGFAIPNIGPAYTQSKMIQESMQQAISGQREEVNKLNGEYEQLFQTLVVAGGLQEDFGRTVATTTENTENLSAALSKLMEIADKEGTGRSLKEFQEWFEKFNNEMKKYRQETATGEWRLNLQMGEMQANKDLGESYVKLGDEYVKADEYMKKSAEQTVENLRNLEGQIDHVVGGLVRAGMAGENMGEALKKALQEVIAKAITLAVVFGIMQLIPGGSAMAGSFGAFMGKGFGLNIPGASTQSKGAAAGSPSQPQVPGLTVVVQGALEGQKFITNTQKPNEVRLAGRSY
jgi:uncharacterized protein YukE